MNFKARHCFCRLPNRPHGFLAKERLFLSKSARKQRGIRAISLETDKSDAVR